MDSLAGVGSIRGQFQFGHFVREGVENHQGQIAPRIGADHSAQICLVAVLVELPLGDDLESREHYTWSQLWCRFSPIRVAFWHADHRERSASFYPPGSVWGRCLQGDCPFLWEAEHNQLVDELRQRCYDPAVVADGKCREACAMSDTPPFDETLRTALAGLDDDDVRIFDDDFEELKSQVRRHQSGKARVVPGTSAVGHSAVVSLRPEFLQLGRTP
jgi:hypothetical protein